MGTYRSLRRIPSLKTIVARRRKRIRYTDFTAAKPVSAPAVSGSKQADTLGKVL